VAATAGRRGDETGGEPDAPSAIVGGSAGE